MEYVDGEVKAVCRMNSWQCQVRRKWSVREKPVAESPVEDYEWKIYPFSIKDELVEDWWLMDAKQWQGIYYLVSVDRPGEKFVLQHDTNHAGVWGPHFEQQTLTEIRPHRHRMLSFSAEDYANWANDRCFFGASRGLAKGSPARTRGDQEAELLLQDMRGPSGRLPDHLPVHRGDRGRDLDPCSFAALSLRIWDMVLELV